MIQILAACFWIFLGSTGSQVKDSPISHTTPASPSEQINWCNLQWPPLANISTGGSVNVYARCYLPGVTTTAGSDPDIKVWIGYSTSNTNPIYWTDWKPAAFNTDFDGYDEYVVALGNTLPAGLYSYASRVQYKDGSYRFGGYKADWGGFWDGVNRVSGILTVGKELATITLGSLVQPYTGTPRPVTVTTNPAGLPVQVTYNGTATVPVAAGIYQVAATVNHTGYQGKQTASLAVYSYPGDEASELLRNQFIWVKFDQVYTQAHLDSALAFHPDVISRGWFRWGDWGDFNYGTYAWMAQQADSRGAVFGGGETVQALYPEEVDASTFSRIVERTPYNKPMYFGGDSTSGIYTGDIQKKEYLDYLLSWMFQQIDAGAGTLHLDGITAVPALNAGYSDFSMLEFNSFLLDKYGDQLGWSSNDSRWTMIFDIDLLSDCTDGTIGTFDYRKFLIRHGYEKNPLAFDFALRKEFGDPWNYDGTYLDARNQAACAYMYNAIENYAASKGRQVTVTNNGYSDYVDYQTMGVWDSWSVSGGRLNITPSYIGHWRGIKEYSHVHLGRDLPLVVFHDWGFGMPFYNEIPEADQILWLRVYAPEVFASGAVFAWPVSGGGNRYQPSQVVRDTIRSLVNWYSDNRGLFVNARWNGQVSPDLQGMTDAEATVLDLLSKDSQLQRRVVHLINKKADAGHNLVMRSNFTIKVPSDEQPRSVWAVSPDFSDYRKLAFAYSDLKATITVPSLDAYTVVVLDYNGKVPQRIHFNNFAVTRPGVADFNPGAYASSGLPVEFATDNPAVAVLVNGKIHVTGTGSCTITASQAGNGDFEPATPVSRELTSTSATPVPERGVFPVTLWPNPTDGLVHLNNLPEEEMPAEVVDVFGRSCLKGVMHNGAFEAGSLGAGVYFLKTGGHVYRFVRR